MTPLIIAAAAAGLVGWVVARSNDRFVHEREAITVSWSNVETELRRRHDLVPSLVATVRGYAAHERSMLDNLTLVCAAAIGTEGPPVTTVRAENQLVVGIRQLLAMSDAYPDLRANNDFLELQRQLVMTEKRIHASRHAYNDEVRAFNHRVESIPSSLVAWGCRHRPAESFELDLLTRGADTHATRS